MAPPIGQRLVRLSFDQFATTITTLLDSQALTGVIVASPKVRQFQALYQEGDLINTSVLQQTNAWADAAATSLTDPTRFAQMTGCAAPTTDACAQGFLGKLAQAAYRRPLTTDESTSLLQLYADEKAQGSSIEEATRLTVQGILISPPTLYRTEFGKSGGMSDIELASELSYFVSNGPPDAPLMTAAQSGALSTAAGMRAQVDRLVAVDTVRQNLDWTMWSYYKLGNLGAVIKDPAVYPAFTAALKASMYTETQKFIENTLWSGKVGDMLTSRKSFVDTNLANLYGVSAPGASATNFVPIEFAEGQRTGIFTQGSLLSLTSNTNTTSVVHRGLFINMTVLCSQSPPPPTDPDVQAKIASQLADSNSTERQKSDYRRTTLPCSGCHGNFDAFGLVLENYDGIGQHRDTYPGNIPIDTSVDLPVQAGGGTVANFEQFVNQVTSNGAFSHCLTANMMQYAFANPSVVNFNDCSVKDISDSFQKTDQTFASLIREIAVSPTFSVRGQ